MLETYIVNAVMSVLFTLALANLIFPDLFSDLFDGDDDTDPDPVGRTTVTGTEGNDLLEPTTTDNEIFALAGDDSVASGLGDDYVYGGGGDDTVNLGAGDDVGYGAAGDDTLWGGLGGDTLFGGADDDVIAGYDLSQPEAAGTDQADTLFGGAGDDHLIMGDGDTVSGGAGADTFFLDLDTDDTDPITITDFDQAFDVLEISYPADTGTGTYTPPTITITDFTDGTGATITVDTHVLKVTGAQGLTAADIVLIED